MSNDRIAEVLRLVKEAGIRPRDFEDYAISRLYFTSPLTKDEVIDERRGVHKINGQANEMPLTSGLDSGTVVIQ